MVSEYLTHGRLHFKLANTMKPGNYLLRVSGRYVKDTYQRTIIEGDKTYYVFRQFIINAHRGLDYAYELDPLASDIQQSMENRALPKIIQQITGDPFMQPFNCDEIEKEWPYSRPITILSKIEDIVMLARIRNLPDDINSIVSSCNRGRGSIRVLP